MTKVVESHQDNLPHDGGMLFSVIIPSYNEEANINRCVESIRLNNAGKFPFEIILVDNGSTDSTVSKAETLGIHIIKNESGKRCKIAELRNMGANKAKGRIIAFLDADMTVPDNWLETAWNYFREGFEGALGFVEAVPPEAGWVGKVWGERDLHRRKKKTDVDFLPGRNIFINHHVFNKIGGFNEFLLTSEDKDLTVRVMKAGYRVTSIPDITVIHYGYEKNFQEFVQKEFWRQSSTLKYAKETRFSFRSLKNPVFSSWHFLLFIILAATLFTQNIFFVLSAFILWILPSALIAGSTSGTRQPFERTALLFFLTFVRWNVAGAALLYQFIHEGIRHIKR